MDDAGSPKPNRDAMLPEALLVHNRPDCEAGHAQSEGDPATVPLINPRSELPK